MNDTLSLIEAAQVLRLGLEAAHELFKRGELPGMSLNQKHVVFLHSDLVTFIHQTALRQAAERRLGLIPVDHVATPRRKRRASPDLDAAEARLRELP